MKRMLITACVASAALGWAAEVQAQSCGTCLSGSGLFKIDNCATIPRRAQPAPIGTYVKAWVHLQDMKAEMDDFVFHRNMWLKGGTELGPLGRYQLDMISSRLPKVPFPVVISTSQDDRLDEARREVIITLLEKRGFTDASRVIVAHPIAEALYAEEASRVAAFYLNAGFGNNGIGGQNRFGGFGGFGGGFGGFGGFNSFR